MKFVPFFIVICAIVHFSIADISTIPPTTTIPPQITEPADIEKIPKEIRKKLILNEEDIPFQYRNLISIDSNGSKHILPSNDLIYRVIVPTDTELSFSIYYYDSESCIEKIYEPVMGISPFKYHPFKAHAFAFAFVSNILDINGKTFTYRWRNTDVYINDVKEETRWIESIPKFQSYETENIEKIYFFDLNINELGSTNCTFEFILPSYYYIAILTYDQENTTSTFEE
uniref:Uncharacterized protein n=1 Tax=Panagrolaimus sp. ES5 TaxID=591445 RepID=A0AC34GFU8_9BILA